MRNALLKYNKERVNILLAKFAHHAPSMCKTPKAKLCESDLHRQFEINCFGANTETHSSAVGPRKKQNTAGTGIKMGMRMHAVPHLSLLLTVSPGQFPPKCTQTVWMPIEFIIRCNIALART